MLLWFSFCSFILFVPLASHPALQIESKQIRAVAYAGPPAVERQQNTPIHTSCQSVSSASVCAGVLFEPLGQPQLILLCS